MIDTVTGERLIVKIHPEFGPYVQVTNYSDSGALEDELDEMSIPYFTGSFDDAIDAGGEEIFFGIVADPIKVQEILDKISFEE